MPAQPLTSVLLATDFSPGAQQALERVLTLPLGPRARVTLLHVLRDDIPGALRKQALQEAERSLEKVMARGRTLGNARGLTGLRWSGDVTEGDAASLVARRARTVEAELVVVGRHGRVPVVDLFLGTTAQKVTRASEVPVLLVQLAATAPYRKVVVALALGKQSADVAREGTRLLGKDAELPTLLHCVGVPFEDFVTLSPAAVAEFEARFRTDAVARLEAVVKKLKLDGARLAVRDGDARALVLDEIAGAAAELVVVGTHGKKGMARFFTGSVAEWVLTHADCDVLVVRA